MATDSSDLAAAMSLTTFLLLQVACMHSLLHFDSYNVVTAKDGFALFSAWLGLNGLTCVTCGVWSGIRRRAWTATAPIGLITAAVMAMFLYTMDHHVSLSSTRLFAPLMFVLGSVAFGGLALLGRSVAWAFVRREQSA